MCQRHESTRPFGRFLIIGGPRQRRRSILGSLLRLHLAQLGRQRLEHLRQRLERVGIGRVPDLLEHRVERLARLRLGQLDGQSLERFRQRTERVGIGARSD